jgi:hypothetical protein
MLARIHIDNNWDYMDDEVYVEMDLPYPLHVGNTLFLKEQSLKQLQKMATANCEVARKYFPDWFSGKSWKAESIEQADMKDLNFKEAWVVKEVSYMEGNPFVDIELYTCLEYDIKQDEVKDLLSDLVTSLKEPPAIIKEQFP